MTVLILTYHYFDSQTPKCGFFDIYHKFRGDSCDVVTLDFKIHGLFGKNPKYSFKRFARIITSSSVCQFTICGPYFLRKFFAGFSVIWNKNKLRDRYDLVFIESSTELFRDNVKRLIGLADFSIYRPSDPIFLCSDINREVNGERLIIESVGEVWSVNNLIEKKMIDHYCFNYDPIKFRVVFNDLGGFSCPIDRKGIPFYDCEKLIFGYGFFPFDWDLINKAAKLLPEYQFVFSGVGTGQRLAENVHHIGVRNEAECCYLASISTFNLLPLKEIGDINQNLYLTRKVVFLLSLKQPLVYSGMSKDLQKFGAILLPSELLPLKQCLLSVAEGNRDWQKTNFSPSEFFLEDERTLEFQLKRVSGFEFKR